MKREDLAGAFVSYYTGVTALEQLLDKLLESNSTEELASSIVLFDKLVAANPTTWTVGRHRSLLKALFERGVLNSFISFLTLPSLSAVLEDDLDEISSNYKVSVVRKYYSLESYHELKDAPEGFLRMFCLAYLTKGFPDAASKLAGRFRLSPIAIFDILVHLGVDHEAANDKFLQELLYVHLQNADVLEETLARYATLPNYRYLLSFYSKYPVISPDVVFNKKIWNFSALPRESFRPTSLIDHRAHVILNGVKALERAYRDSPLLRFVMKVITSPTADDRVFDLALRLSGGMLPPSMAEEVLQAIFDRISQATDAAERDRIVDETLLRVHFSSFVVHAEGRVLFRPLLRLLALLRSAPIGRAEDVLRDIAFPALSCVVYVPYQVSSELEKTLSHLYTLRQRFRVFSHGVRVNPTLVSFSEAELKFLLRRVSGDNLGEYGPQIGRLFNLNPFLCSEQMLRVLAGYNNMIGLFASVFAEHLSPFSRKVLVFWIMQRSWAGADSGRVVESNGDFLTGYYIKNTDFVSNFIRRSFAQDSELVAFYLFTLLGRISWGSYYDVFLLTKVLSNLLSLKDLSGLSEPEGITVTAQNYRQVLNSGDLYRTHVVPELKRFLVYANSEISLIGPGGRYESAVRPFDVRRSIDQMLELVVRTREARRLENEALFRLLQDRNLASSILETLFRVIHESLFYRDISLSLRLKLHDDSLEVLALFLRTLSVRFPSLRVTVPKRSPFNVDYLMWYISRDLEPMEMSAPPDATEVERSVFSLFWRSKLEDVETLGVDHYKEILDLWERVKLFGHSGVLSEYSDLIRELREEMKRASEQKATVEPGSLLRGTECGEGFYRFYFYKCVLGRIRLSVEEALFALSFTKSLFGDRVVDFGRFLFSPTQIKAVVLSCTPIELDHVNLFLGRLYDDSVHFGSLVKTTTEVLGWRSNGHFLAIRNMLSLVISVDSASSFGGNLVDKGEWGDLVQGLEKVVADRLRSETSQTLLTMFRTIGAKITGLKRRVMSARGDADR